MQRFLPPFQESQRPSACFSPRPPTSTIIPSAQWPSEFLSAILQARSLWKSVARSQPGGYFSPSSSFSFFFLLPSQVAGKGGGRVELRSTIRSFYSLARRAGRPNCGCSVPSSHARISLRSPPSPFPSSLSISLSPLSVCPVCLTPELTHFAGILKVTVRGFLDAKAKLVQTQEHNENRYVVPVPPVICWEM